MKFSSLRMFYKVEVRYCDTGWGSKGVTPEELEERVDKLEPSVEEIKKDVEEVKLQKVITSL